MFAKMINMAKSPEEMKSDMADMPMAMPGNKVSGPVYPYGLCISLDDETLKKLGLDGDLPEVGEVVQFTAMARVTSASMNEREDSDGKKSACCRVELQITDMGIPAMNGADEAVEKSEARRKRFYGKPVADTDDDGE